MPELCLEPQEFAIRIDRTEYELCTYIADIYIIRTTSCMVAGAPLTLIQHKSIHNSTHYFKAIYGDRVRFFVSDAPFLK